MMSLVMYLAVLLVSASSVLFGLGWLSGPEPQYQAPPVQTARQAVPAAPKADTHLSPVYPTVSASPSAVPGKPAVTSAPPATGAKPAVASAPAPAAAPNATPPATGQTEAATAPAPPPPACDIQACAAAYYSFRASDCTYQPYDGPRRLCTKGTPPAQTQAKPAADAASSDVDAQAARAQAPACNVAACEAAYRTFDPSDCTYQPYNGPRRLCTK